MRTESSRPAGVTRKDPSQLEKKKKKLEVKVGVKANIAKLI